MSTCAASGQQSLKARQVRHTRHYPRDSLARASVSLAGRELPCYNDARATKLEKYNSALCRHCADAGQNGRNRKRDSGILLRRW
jgi:hypothetical protein